LFGGEIPKRGIVHDPVEYLLVAFHAVDEEPFEHAVEHMLEVVERVGLGGGFQSLVPGGGLGDLVEEELVGLLEVRAEPVIQFVDQPGQRDVLVVAASGSDLRRPLERLRLALFKTNTALADLLKPIAASGAGNARRCRQRQRRQLLPAQLFEGCAVA
jgi:hypothetical protein